jgi:hypothetical protein
MVPQPRGGSRRVCDKGDFGSASPLEDVAHVLRLFAGLRFFFGPIARAPGFGMLALGFTRSARRVACSSGSGMWTASPGFGIPSIVNRF